MGAFVMVVKLVGCALFLIACVQTQNSSPRKSTVCATMNESLYWPLFQMKSGGKSFVCLMFKENCQRRLIGQLALSLFKYLRTA